MTYDYRAARAAVFASALKPLHRFVLLVLIEHQPNCAPSIARIASMTGLNRTSVMAAIQSLELSGVITITRADGRRSEYRVNLSSAPTGRGERPVAESDTTSRGERPQPVAESDPKQTTKRTRKQTIAVPLPSDWVPTESHRAFCAKNNLDIDVEVFGFKGWAEGRTAVSWNGTFSTRLSNSVKWRPKANGFHRDPAPPRGRSAAEVLREAGYRE